LNDAMTETSLPNSYPSLEAHCSGLAGATDERIASLIVRDSEAAFDILYERHFRTAVSVASRYIRDPLSPEDVAQEAFAALWKSRHRYSHELGSIRTWVMAITRNRAIDAIRHERSRPRATVRLEDAGGAAASDDVAAETEECDQRRRTAAAIAALPELQREVVSLHTYSDLSHSEIARHIGAPLGTVKSRSRLAMVTLRGVLAR
jgi:RNA polymerase sigma-70 factor, ECF subfamily